jgi:hypothetical protein
MAVYIFLAVTSNCVYVNCTINHNYFRCAFNGHSSSYAVLQTIISQNLRHCSIYTYSVLFAVWNFKKRLESMSSSSRKIIKCCAVIFCVHVIVTALLVFVIQRVVCHFLGSCQRLQHSCGSSSSRLRTLCADLGRLRTRGHGKRSYAQNVTLKPNSVGRTLSGWGPIHRRMGWVLAANQVRHSIDTVLSCQSGPKLVMIITQHRVRQLCIWCGSRHDAGLRLRSS